MENTVRLPLAKAEFLAELLRPYGIHAEVRSEHYVDLDTTSLEALAGLPEDHDGYFEGGFVFIGGTEYVVRPR